MIFTYPDPPEKIFIGAPRQPRYYKKNRDGHLIPKKYRKKGYGWKNGYWAGPEGRVLKNPRQAGTRPAVGVSLNQVLYSKSTFRTKALMDGLYEFFKSPKSIEGQVSSWPVRVNMLLLCRGKKLIHDLDNRMALYYKAWLDTAHKPRHGRVWINGDSTDFVRGRCVDYLPEQEKDLLVIKLRETETEETENDF